jgi:hypothetical protein
MFTMVATIIMLMESHTKTSVSNLKEWDSVKWVNKVREDVTDCCDYSKEPSDFVKGEKFLEWFIDCSLLKDTGPWSSCELFNEMRAKPVEYAATGSPRAVGSADKLLSATAEAAETAATANTTTTTPTKRLEINFSTLVTKQEGFYTERKSQNRILSRFTESYVDRTSDIHILPRITQEHKSLALSLKCNGDLDVPYHQL